jgi:hypothetical protein
MQSILQDDTTRCYICGGNACGDPLDKHHVFGGALRKKSEKYGLTIYLHHNKCHIFGAESVHQNAAINNELKANAQWVAMKRYGWTVDDFRREFYKNYL